MEMERRNSEGEDSSENDEQGQVQNEDEKSKIKSETHGKLFTTSFCSFIQISFFSGKELTGPQRCPPNHHLFPQILEFSHYNALKILGKIKFLTYFLCPTQENMIPEVKDTQTTEMLGPRNEDLLKSPKKPVKSHPKIRLIPKKVGKILGLMIQMGTRKTSKKKIRKKENTEEMKMM